MLGYMTIFMHTFRIILVSMRPHLSIYLQKTFVSKIIGREKQKFILS